MKFLPLTLLVVVVISCKQPDTFNNLNRLEGNISHDDNSSEGVAKRLLALQLLGNDSAWAQLATTPGETPGDTDLDKIIAAERAAALGEFGKAYDQYVGVVQTSPHPVIAYRMSIIATEARKGRLFATSMSKFPSPLIRQTTLFMRQQHDSVQLIGNEIQSTKNESPSIIAASCIVTARSLRAQGKIKEGISAALKADSIATAANDKAMAARACNLAAGMYFQQEDRPSALVYAKRSVKLAREMGSRISLLRFMFTLSYLYRESKDPVTTAEHTGLIEEMIPLSQLPFNRNSVINAQNVTAYYYTIKGNTDHARIRNYAKTAYDSLLAFNPVPGGSFAGNDYSLFLRLVGEPKEAEVVSRVAFDAALKSKVDHEISEAALHLGLALLAQGKVKEARTVYDEGYKVVDGKNVRDRWVFDNYMSRLEWAEGKKEKALQRSEVACDSLSSIEYMNEALGRAGLAQMYFELKRKDDALRHARRVIALSDAYVSFEALSTCLAIEALYDREKYSRDQAATTIDELIVKAKSYGHLATVGKLNKIKTSL